IFKSEKAADTSWIGLAVTGLLPLILIVGFIIFMMRQAQGTNNQALSFGKSRARMFLGNKTVVTFADVAGVDEAKTELQEVVEFLKYPEKFNSLGARIPRGVLLVGPPGTGKTLMVWAVAGEAGVPFFSISGADLANLVNEAAILSARRNRKVMGMSEVQEALERIVAGPERKSRIISDAEKEIIAYHEGGHAVVQRVLPKCDPVQKVTIISRGMALGYTMALPTEDRYLQSKTEFEDKIAGLLAGNAAEKLIFG